MNQGPNGEKPEELVWVGEKAKESRADETMCAYFFPSILLSHSKDIRRRSGTRSHRLVSLVCLLTGVCIGD